jgi:hypothetical protein
MRRNRQGKKTHLRQFKLRPRCRLSVRDGEVLKKGRVTDDGGSRVAVLVGDPLATGKERSARKQERTGKGGNALLGDIGVTGTYAEGFEGQYGAIIELCGCSKRGDDPVETTKGGTTTNRCTSREAAPFACLLCA